MVLLTLNKVSSTITKWIGPSLFRSGLSLRNKIISPTKTGTTTPNSSYWIDLLCLLPYSQRLLSLAIYEESKIRTTSYILEKQKEEDETRTTTARLLNPKEISKIRLNVYDEILRPTIIPNNAWNDVEESWRYNTRLVAWLRKEFLISKYGPYIQDSLLGYPLIKQSPQLQTPSSRRFLLNLMNRGIIDIDTLTGKNKTNNNQDTFYKRVIMIIMSTIHIYNYQQLTFWSKLLRCVIGQQLKIHKSKYIYTCEEEEKVDWLVVSYYGYLTHTFFLWFVLILLKSKTSHVTDSQKTWWYHSATKTRTIIF